MSRSVRPILVGSLALLAACGQQPSNSAPSTSGAVGLSASTQAAATAFLATLPDSTRAVANMPFEGTERTRMYFVPTVMVQGGRGGLPLSRMTPAQREAAWRMVGTGLSSQGLETARAITANEARLYEIEMADTAIGNRWQRNPLTYFASVFGTPQSEEPWGWRFEGHHLSVHTTSAGPQGVTVVPVFFGANPHRVVAGPGAGTRVLAREEDVARELVTMLDATQRAKAILTQQAWRDMSRRADPASRPVPSEGLPAKEMNPAQRAKLRQLMEVYVHRQAPQAANNMLAWIDFAGFDNIHFLWNGDLEPGKPHYYRVHGPTFLIEYDNAQNNANHSHTVLRDLRNDFGGDMLAAHYKLHPHANQ